MTVRMYFVGGIAISTACAKGAPSMVADTVRVDPDPDYDKKNSDHTSRENPNSDPTVVSKYWKKSINLEGSWILKLYQDPTFFWNTGPDPDPPFSTAGSGSDRIHNPDFKGVKSHSIIEHKYFLWRENSVLVTWKFGNEMKYLYEMITVWPLPSFTTVNIGFFYFCKTKKLTHKKNAGSGYFFWYENPDSLGIRSNCKIFE